MIICLTLSWRRPLSYRNQSIDLQSKSMDWFLYDNGLFARTNRARVVELHMCKSSKLIHRFLWLSLCIVCQDCFSNRQFLCQWSKHNFSYIFCVFKVFLIGFTLGYFLDVFPYIHSYNAIVILSILSCCFRKIHDCHCGYRILI